MLLLKVQISAVKVETEEHFGSSWSKRRTQQSLPELTVQKRCFQLPQTKSRSTEIESHRHVKYFLLLLICSCHNETVMSSCDSAPAPVGCGFTPSTVRDLSRQGYQVASPTQAEHRYAQLVFLFVIDATFIPQASDSVLLCSRQKQHPDLECRFGIEVCRLRFSAELLSDSSVTQTQRASGFNRHLSSCIQYESITTSN